MTLLSNVREDGGSRDKARELWCWRPAAPHASSSALRTNWTRPSASAILRMPYVGASPRAGGKWESHAQGTSRAWLAILAGP